MPALFHFNTISIIIQIIKALKLFWELQDGPSRSGKTRRSHFKFLSFKWRVLSNKFPISQFTETNCHPVAVGAHKGLGDLGQLNRESILEPWCHTTRCQHFSILTLLLPVMIEKTVPVSSLLKRNKWLKPSQTPLYRNAYVVPKLWSWNL